MLYTSARNSIILCNVNRTIVKNIVKGTTNTRTQKYYKSSQIDNNMPGEDKQVVGSEIFADKEIFPEYPTTGPLAKYRQNATFDWRKLKLMVEDEEALLMRKKIWGFARKHPVFQKSMTDRLTMDEQRHLATKRMMLGHQQHFFGIDDYVRRSDLLYIYVSSLMAYDSSYAVKLTLTFGMFANVIRTLGGDRLYKYVEASDNMEIFGAFALTEVAHGTNARGMRTTATYDPKSECFIMHSPDFEAAKCWVGNLGKTCSHAIVYAQLYTPDGKCHGLNAFLVPIRDTKTMLAHPGVLVGDLGEKIGLNGVDNGFVMFNQYKIPREYLLSRTGDVTKEGEYVTPFKDKRKRLGASLGALSGGRVSICGIAATYLNKAITIAIRYSAARCQFGPKEGGEEYPVLEYQAQQHRLLPHLAAGYATCIFAHWIAKQHGDMTMKSFSGEQVADMGMELHALSSAAKPCCTWQARDTIQECREACGGHGYLKIAGLGDLRNDNDANCTYEGENNVLIQQASNWLLGLAARGVETFKNESPLGSAAFLSDFEQIFQRQFNRKQTQSTNEILSALNWLCAYLLQKTGDKARRLNTEGQSAFDVRNNIQAFNANSLAIAYAQRNVYWVFKTWADALPESAEKQAVMELVLLHGLQLIVKHSGIFYQGGYFSARDDLPAVEAAILDLLVKVQRNAVALVDAISYPDFILNSALGMSDGDVYKNLEAAITQSPGVYERPSWWKDIVFKESYLAPKL